MDCDVERLTPADFESTDSNEMRLFVIEQAKLAEFGEYLDHSLKGVLRTQAKFLNSWTNHCVEVHSWITPSA